MLDLVKRSSLSRAIAWVEVHPSDVQQGRSFALIVGQGRQLMLALLRTGGIAAEAVGKVKPDPFYVDQALNTLDHLEEMGIPIVCERWLTLPNNPAVVNADLLYAGASNAAKSLPDGGVVLKRTKNLDYSSSSSCSSPAPNAKKLDANEMVTAFRDEDVDDESKNEDESSLWELHRSGRRARMNYSNDGVPTNAEDEEELVTYRVNQLTLSPENTLFHFVQIDSREAVFLSPLTTSEGTLHKELLAAFRSAAGVIHNNLQIARRARNAAGNGWLGKSAVASAKEEGVLVHWQPEMKGKSLPPLSYWVCGRLEGSTETFVCYHDSAPQNVVELAFRLAQGVHL